MGEEPGNPHRSACFTDLYELTMLQAYHAEAIEQRCVFELFYRRLPAQRNYLVTCGLEDVLTYLERLRFSSDDLAFLRSLDRFSPQFLDHLARLRFAGDVYAAAEGTIVFANEPVLQIEAPIQEAQLVETYVINQMHLQTVLATKAARVIAAAAGRSVVDFGSRRAHGTDAALKVARTSYLAGAAGTSNVLAAKEYGIPLLGTMAHSYIQAHDDEAEAFRAFTHVYPDTTLLVDTYDTLSGVQLVIRLRDQLGDQFRVRAIRLDSGDLVRLATEARRMLDSAGLRSVEIFASNSLDEYAIAALLESGAPIDGFGVGTKLAVSSDAPFADATYKLVEYAGQPRMKRSSSKSTWPGQKQVFRVVQNGRMVRDIVGRHTEQLDGQPLLQQVMRGGHRVKAAATDLENSRQHMRSQMTLLPPELLQLEKADQSYEVQVSPALQSLRASMG